MISAMKKGNWLLTVPLVIVGIAYLYFLFLPGKAEINRLRAEVAAKQRQVSEARFMKLQIHKTEQEIAQTQQHIKKWRGRQAHEPSHVLARIGDEVQRSGARASTFDPQPTIQHEAIRQTDLALGVDGRFAQIFDMLQRFEALDSNIRIQRVSIEAGEKMQDLLSSKVTLAIFSVNRDNSN
jgi:Tfp pilus assembly protein PilO